MQLAIIQWKSRVTYLNKKLEQFDNFEGFNVLSNKLTNCNGGWTFCISEFYLVTPCAIHIGIVIVNLISSFLCNGRFNNYCHS